MVARPAGAHAPRQGAGAVPTAPGDGCPPPSQAWWRISTAGTTGLRLDPPPITGSWHSSASDIGAAPVDPGHSTQPKVRVTAFFQSAYSFSTWAAAIVGSQVRSTCQFRRSSPRSLQYPMASPAA